MDWQSAMALFVCFVIVPVGTGCLLKGVFDEDERGCDDIPVGRGE